VSALRGIALAGFGLWLSAGAAWGQDAFTTINSGWFTQDGYDLLGGGSELPSAIAWRFTSASNGPLTAIYIAAQQTSGTPQPATLSIYGSSGGTVGALLQSADVILPDHATLGFAFDIHSGVVMTAGAEYFFALTVPPGVGARWSLFGPPFRGGPEAFRVGDGPWQYRAAADLYYPGFRVETRCPGNCDGSTTAPILNVLDFNCFIGRFMALDPYGNCDGSTAPPEFNVLDFNCFLNRFTAGCP
jgi:hypothetical protein